MRLRLAYGRNGLWIHLPDDAPVTVIEPISTPSLTELLAPHDTVVVVFSDITRPMPNDRVLPPLLEELARAGVPDGQVVLLNALGTHRPQTGDELEQMLGPDLVERYRLEQHDAWDDSNLVAAGTNHTGRHVRVNRTYMDASIRILTGFIEPHLFAGFSGGPKAVLPGIADVESILDNHGAAMIAHPRATWAVTEGNPLWEEMLSVALSAAPHFLLNVTLNRDRQITGVYAGGLVEAHRAGLEAARRATLRTVAEPFDIVVTSNSGYPLDLNLYQSGKGMSAASQIVRPGGDIIVVAECWDGIPSHGEYKRLLWEADCPRQLLDRVMAPGFRCHDQWAAQLQAQIQSKARVHVYAGGLSDDELRNALVIPCRSVEGTVAEIRRRNPGASIAILPDGPQTVPCLPSA
jgi:nickel-dependent lactate racemase